MKRAKGEKSNYTIVSYYSDANARAVQSSYGIPSLDALDAIPSRETLAGDPHPGWRQIRDSYWFAR